MKIRPFLLLAAMVPALSTPRIFANEHVFDVTGIVRAPVKEGRLIVTHDDIPGFMTAMTMGFTLEKPAEAGALAVGDRIRFHLRVSETASSASDIEIVNRSAPSSEPTASAATPRSRLREGDRVPSFSLLDQDGHSFGVRELNGHFTIVTFIFSRCPIPEYCPAMAFRFGQLQKAILGNATLAERARLLSVTLDPAFDRPEILKSYGAAVGANPAIWQFVTGEKAEIDSLARAFAVFTELNGAMLDHTLCTALIDSEGRVNEIWRGNGWKVDELVSALKRANAQ